MNDGLDHVLQRDELEETEFLFGSAQFPGKL
jgi:hypothetical protein